MPDAPTLSVQFPPSPRPPVRHPGRDSSFDRECEPSRDPTADRAQCDQLPRGQLCVQCSPSGIRVGESKEVLETRSASADAAEANRVSNGCVEQDAPNYVDGKREWAPAKGVEDSDIPTHFLGSTRGVDNKGALGSGKGKREQAPVQEAKDSDDPSTTLDGDAMDTSETLAGKRERAGMEGVMD